MAEKEFQTGDHVSWASHSGRAYGVVKEKLIDRTHVRGHPVNASEDEPQYRIRHDHSGRDVAHRPEVLRHEPE
jgi:Hypervirulence associated proteins TUDOR domain